MSLDLYTRQCSLGVTAQMLSVAAGTVANGGVNPMTKKQVFDAELILNHIYDCYRRLLRTFG